MKKIMLVEDDLNLSNGICLALKNSNTNILQCHSLASARKALAGEATDLILLDINLPDGSGLDFLRETKTTTQTPVILLTANDTEMDVVIGLEYGADDYITKPFSLAILRARVNTQLNRAQKLVFSLYSIDDYLFNFHKMEFLKNGTAIDLSKTEQKLLLLLIENKGATVPRDTLLERVWSDGTAFVDENTLSVAVKRLRDKLGKAKQIKTIYGIGYMWAVEK